jgi:hypothetical protein
MKGWFYALIISMIGAYAGTAKAENPEREKCTCDTQVEGEPNNGAWVKNATACWSTEIKDRQWCDITIQSLEGSQAHAAVVIQLLDRKDDTAALEASLQEQFQEFVATAQDGLLPLNFDLARDVVPGLLSKNQGILIKCVNALSDRTFGKPGVVLEGEGGLRCSVGDSSAWLRLEFQVGDVWLAYTIAPPPT